MDNKHENNRSESGMVNNAATRLFDCQSNVNAPTRLCTQEEFDAMIDSPEVERLCSDIARAREQMERGLMPPAQYEKLKAEKKKALPAFVFGGHSSTGARKTADMRPSGLATLDIDHIEGNPKEVYDDKISGHEKELGIVFAHVSPSGRGCHLIYQLKEGETRAEANERVFSSLHLDTDPRLPEGYDKAVKDMTRCSFAVPRGYFFHIDNETLFYRQENTQTQSYGQETSRDDDTAAQSSPATASQPAATGKPLAAESRPATVATIRQGAPTAQAPIQDQMTQEQAEEIFDRACSDMASLNPRGIDITGLRHNNLTAVLSTGICKVVPQALMRQVVARRMPTFCAEADCQALIGDFYGKYLDSSAPMSRLLAKIRMECLGLSAKGTAEATDTAADEAADAWESQQLELSDKITKCLPAGLRDTLTGLPSNMKMPVLCTVLPLAASYADGVSVKYRDGSEHNLGLMSAIIGRSAGGKGICAERLEPWMKKMNDISDKASKEEDEYREKIKTRKANEKAPQDPHVFKPRISFTISLTQLLNRLKNAQGHTLFSFCEELATVIDSNNRGEWSNKRAAYTLAFDGGDFSQDYYSADSVSASVRIHYNWSVTGTYGAFHRFFRGDAVEGGLASRVLFSEMPDTSFQSITKYPRLSAKNIARIDEAVDKLCEAHGAFNLPRVCAALDKWDEEKRLMAQASCDYAADYFRRRAAVIGFRSATVAYLLTGKESKGVVEFATLMAQYAFLGQMHLLAKSYYDTTAKANAQQQRTTANGNIFDNLPKRFTRDDLKKQKPYANAHCLAQMVSVWKKSRWIEKVATNTWEKKADLAGLLADVPRHGQKVTKSLSR